MVNRNNTMDQITHIEFYHSKSISKSEVDVMRERVKNIHFYQIADHDALKEAMKPNRIKLDNNKYFKEFNLFAN